MQEPQETQVPSLGQENPVEKGMATHSSSCQNNPMDRGPWWAIVQWVTKSRTWTEHTYPSSARWKLQMNNVLSFPPCDFNEPKSVHELVEWFRAVRDIPDPVLSLPSLCFTLFSPLSLLHSLFSPVGLCSLLNLPISFLPLGLCTQGALHLEFFPSSLTYGWFLLILQSSVQMLLLQAGLPGPRGWNLVLVVPDHIVLFAFFLGNI